MYVCVCIQLRLHHLIRRIHTYTMSPHVHTCMYSTKAACVVLAGIITLDKAQQSQNIYIMHIVILWNKRFLNAILTVVCTYIEASLPSMHNMTHNQIYQTKHPSMYTLVLRRQQTIECDKQAYVCSHKHSYVATCTNKF